MATEMTLDLDELEVETLEMGAPAPMRAVTTSDTCPKQCDTDWDCTAGVCSAECDSQPTLCFC